MTVGKLRDYLKGLSDDTPCCYDVWLPDDIIEFIEEELPEDAPITPDEVGDTLYAMYKVRDSTIGTTWDTVRECLPDSVKDRLHSDD